METLLSTDAIAALRSQARGELIQRGDPGYDAARKVFNGMIDRHPALILRSTDVADVIAGVNFAREKQRDTMTSHEETMILIRETGAISDDLNVEV